jgi:hypothetical protein
MASMGYNPHMGFDNQSYGGASAISSAYFGGMPNQPGLMHNQSEAKSLGGLPHPPSELHKANSMASVVSFAGQRALAGT